MVKLSEYGKFALRVSFVGIAAVFGIILILWLVPDDIKPFIGIALLFSAVGLAFGISRPKSEAIEIIKYQALAAAHGVKVADPTQFKTKKKQKKTKNSGGNLTPTSNGTLKKTSSKSSMMDDFMSGLSEIKDKVTSGDSDSPSILDQAKNKLGDLEQGNSDLNINVDTDVKDEKEKLETPPEDDGFQLSIHTPDQ